MDYFYTTTVNVIQLWLASTGKSYLQKSWYDEKLCFKEITLFPNPQSELWKTASKTGLI